ncbi:MAG TPA: PQQ-dependent sugar dehydrogenase [Thermoanaerobaculia bacterium]|nr:PQQ-dependent sugar dehydrogenase [Thermoanaerobaculia bacterium]
MSLPLLFLSSLLAFARPAAPTFIEPETEGQVVSGSDVHMVTLPFSDPDGHGHRCSDWEILLDEDVVWRTSCAEGAEKVHIHLADGAFVGTRTGFRELLGGLYHRLRARHRDDSGDPATEWSNWSERVFRTAVPSVTRPMRLRDVLVTPPITWDTFPPAGASLRLELIDGVTLLELNHAGYVDAPPVNARTAIRVVLEAGEALWSHPPSELSFDDENGDRRTIYLPAFSLGPQTKAQFWVEANGGTHQAAGGDDVPVFEVVARASPVPWTAERGFVVEHFAGDLQLPVNIAFVTDPGDEPDSPFFYVAELYGNVKVVTRSGEVRDYATGLLDFDPTGFIPGSGESGVAGIAYDPPSGDLFITRVSWPDRSNRDLIPQVVRLRSSDDGLRAEAVETVLSLRTEKQSASHQISNITIGPDRRLYVHFGDSIRHELAQDLSTVLGKIIRINFDGTPPEDNPFTDGADGFIARDLIFARGFRNPFGGAWRAADQSLYEVENGPRTDRLAKVVSGANYMWDGTDASMLHGAVAVWTDPVAPVQIAFVQRETFEGSGFPERKMSSAFVTESGPTWATAEQESGKTISEMVLAGDTLARGPSTFVRYNGSGKSSVAAIAAGPDGLYFSDLYKDAHYETPVDRGANVFRIRWIGYADFEARAVTPDGLTLSFFDRSEAQSVTGYAWDFGDGTFGSEPNPRHTYAQPGTYIVRLTVNGTLVETKKMRVGAATLPLAGVYADGTRQEPAIDFHWGEVAPFTARWSGVLRPRFSETYRFDVETAGTARLLIDGAVVTGEVELEAGRDYAVAVEYEHATGSASLRVWWESASQRRLPIPQTSTLPRRRAVE